MAADEPHARSDRIAIGSLIGAESTSLFTYDVNESTLPSTQLTVQALQAIYDWYKDVHGYLAIAVCVFGIVANILNIVVLTRKNMISATNCILTGLAVSDGLTMVAYLPFALRFYVLYGTESTPERNSLQAIRFMQFYACFSVVVHTVSIWLTVVLAVFRFISVKYPRHGAVWCSLERAKISVLAVYLVTILVCIPNFVTVTITEATDEEARSRNETSKYYVITFKNEDYIDETITNLNFWIQAIPVKLVPCLGLTVLSILLVRTMKQAEKRRKKLRGKPTGDERRPRGGRNTNRTTRMLLVVVALFLFTEFPQGILNLLSGILHPNFVDDVYFSLGDLMDILALINNGINFILYCSMSKQFRDVFFEVFMPASCNRGRGQQASPTCLRNSIVLQDDIAGGKRCASNVILEQPLLVSKTSQQQGSV